MCRPQQAEKDRAEFDAEWKELGKLIAQDRKLRETLRQRQLDRNRDLRYVRESSCFASPAARKTYCCRLL